MKAIDTCSAQLLPVDHQLSRGGCSTVHEFVAFECADNVIGRTPRWKALLFNPAMDLIPLDLSDGYVVVAPGIGVAKVHPGAFPFAYKRLRVNALRRDLRKRDSGNKRERCQNDDQRSGASRAGAVHTEP